MEDYVYAVCPVHGNVAWDVDRPWDAYWCCEGDDWPEVYSV